jgi:hypothetical protein
MLVAGVDSFTQPCKVVLCDADDGTVMGRGGAPHPDGTETDRPPGGKRCEPQATACSAGPPGWPWPDSSTA